MLSRPRLALAALAALLLLPSLILGVSYSDSSKYNYVWASQFFEQMREGHFYPRWLPGAFDGLGSPAFFFYPPLAFFADALAGFATFDLLPVTHRLPVTSWLLLCASGWTMLAWLRAQTGPNAAFCGAAAYMAAPYHLIDHFVRGAFAEFAFYAVLPCAMLAVRGACAGGCRAVAALAVCMALLLLAHLPTALLASVTVLLMYALFEASQAADRRAGVAALLRCGCGILLGAGLAAAYLVPAITLQGYVSIDRLWTPFFRVENWMMLAVADWPRPRVMTMICSLALAALMLVFANVVLARGMPAGQQRAPVFWAVSAAVCLLLMSGAVPWFWTLVPFVAKVQFPWRLLTLVEFSVVTGLALAWPRKMLRATLAAFAASALLAAPGLFLATKETGKLLRDTWGYWPAFQREADAHLRDADEYLPAGYTFEGPDLGPRAWPIGPLARCVPAAALCEARPTSNNGGLVVRLNTGLPTTVILHRFAFPIWHAATADGTALDLRPDATTRLVSFAAPPGVSVVTLSAGPTSAERAGWGISLLSALLVAATLAAYRAKQLSARPAVEARSAGR